MQRVRNWLPAEAFGGEAVKAALASVFADWPESWFARATAAISAVRAGPDPPEATQGLHIKGAQAGVELSGHGKRRLLEAVLGVDLSTEVMGECDRHVLDVLVGRIVDDLVARLDVLLGDDLADDGAQMAIAVSLAGHDALSISIPVHALIPLLKARLGAARASEVLLRSRGDAIRRTTVTAHGVLARADLALQDVRQLAVGDVLILDRALNEPAELYLRGSDTALARGKWTRAGGQISIQL